MSEQTSLSFNIRAGMRYMLVSSIRTAISGFRKALLCRSHQCPRLLQLVASLSSGSAESGSFPDKAVREERMPKVCCFPRDSTIQGIHAHRIAGSDCYNRDSGRNVATRLKQHRQSSVYTN